MSEHDVVTGLVSQGGDVGESMSEEEGSGGANAPGLSNRAVLQAVRSLLDADNTIAPYTQQARLARLREEPHLRALST